MKFAMRWLGAGALVTVCVLGWSSNVSRDAVVAQGSSQPTVMKRIYTGTDGLSHVEDIALDAKTVMEKVTGVEVRVGPPGRFSDWHVGPQRQYIINLAGSGQLEVAEGKVDLAPGSMEYIDDLTGKGHTTRTTSKEERVSIWLKFEDQKQRIGPLNAKNPTAAMAADPAMAGSQGAQYPITIVPPGKGPYSFPAGYQTPWDRIQIMVTHKMSPNLFVLHGSEGLDPAHPEASGGRAMALFGPDGVLLVDSQNRQVAEKTLKTVQSFTNAPIRMMVNTHVHSDHTGGNAFFARQGVLIYSQEDLRNEMLRPPPRANGEPAPAPDMAGIPAATYRYNPATPEQPAVTFYLNGETVDFIAMMPSHTAGDTIVRFRKANVIYIEDFYRNFGYPFADQANGGSIKGMLDAVDLIQKMAGPDTVLVPGHGTLVKKQDLLPYRAMLVDIMARVKTLRDQGKSLKEVLAANLTAPYDKTTLGDTQQSKDRFITEAYDEVKDFPPVVDGKRTMPRHP